ncbi:PAS domain S-box protein [Gilvimarinus xylanilyticus]|uniref:histidine kinase n=1 Tax=Gilvimarinus xylanilyticus TaxID=2944139 RepID=A0A9X2KV99_9GAMM|nr:PAS domain S-box protein [Gilvimarinus xylanilyticus]MCP8897840.1 PAS domain S-box protein [Gilvimarinus xylanilyticus]
MYAAILLLLSLGSFALGLRQESGLWSYLGAGFAGVLIFLLGRWSGRVGLPRSSENGQVAPSVDSSEVAYGTRECLQLALENGQSGYWQWDILAGEVTFSDHWKHMLGADQAEALEGDKAEWTERVHPDDIEECNARLLAHVKGDTPLFEHEHRIREVSGEYVWFLTRGRVIKRDRDGKALTMLGVYTRIDERKRGEFIAQKQQQALKKLNDIASLPGTSAKELLRQSLVLGAEYLELPLGIVSYIEGNDYTILVQCSPPDTLKDNQKFHLPECFCVETLRYGDVLAYHHVAESNLAKHPCYISTQLETYIGAPVWVGDQLYGTLNFSSPHKQSQPFSEQALDFVRLMARWVGATLEREFANREYRELSSRFSKLSDSLPGCVCQFQMHPDGSSFFAYASRGIEDIYGVTPEQAKQSSEAVFARIHADDVPRVGEKIKSSAENLTTWNDIYRVNHPRKGLIWVRGQTQPEKLSNGDVIWHGYLWDVTDEVEAEASRRSSDRWRRAILDATNVSFIATDREGIIRTFNQGAEKLLGYSAAEVIGKVPVERFHCSAEIEARIEQARREGQDDVETPFDALIYRARQGIPDEEEWHYRRGDGSLVLVKLSVTAVVDDKGALEGYLGVAQDISLLRTQEEALRSYAERTQAILDNAADGIVVVNDTGNIETFNLAAEKIFAINADDVVGRNFNTLINAAVEKDDEAVNLPWNNAQRESSSAEFSEREILALRGQGETFPMALSLSEITHNNESQYIAIVRDISERKRIEQLKNEFIAIVSHELRTPLTAISGALRLLESGTLGGLSEAQVKMTSIAHANSERLIALVNDLLDMEKLVAGKMTFASCHQTLLPLLERALENLTTFASQASVTLTLDERPLRQLIGSRTAVVNVDAVRFEQVMANLLSNAIKFSPAGAEVNVRVEWQPAQVKISVIDSGPGIPDQFKPLIFQKFSQVDTSSTRRKGGTGLGLAISKQIVEKMSGHIGFTSREGEGACFYVTLPASVGTQPATGDPHVKPRVLQVEDDRFMLDLVAAITGESFELVQVENLAEARELLHEQVFDLVMLDVLLPDGDGLSLLEPLKLNGNPSVLVVSQVSLNRAQRQSVSGFLEKSERLTDSLVLWLDRWLAGC